MLNRSKPVRLVRLLVSTLIEAAKFLVFGWASALAELLRGLCDFFRRWRSRNELPGRAGKGSEAPCNPINEPAFNQPDPLIYAQYDLMARGYAVTWDNPDIELRKGGVAVPSSQIDPNTDYEIVARIWNNSTDAVIAGLPVIFSYLSFGAGMKINLIGATSLPRLGVKGGPDHPAFASITWKTPPTPGHYCLLVLLAPVDDANFANNLGQENVAVAKAASPAEFSFQLHNESDFSREFRLEVDTYTLPRIEPAGRDTDDSGPAAGRPTARTPLDPVPAVHDRARYPVPTGWSVEIDPEETGVEAGGDVEIKVRITPPAGFGGRLAFNVNAFAGNTFVGGVTLYAEA